MTTPSTIILLTGANSGVGYAATKVILSSSPHYHVVMAGRSSQKIEAAAAEMKVGGMKGSVSTLVLDVTDEESISKAVEATEEQFGRIDVLVNNAGIVSFNQNLKREYEEILATNVIGPILVTDAFTPLLLKSNDPRVIHVTSGLGSLSRAEVTTNVNPKEDWTAYRVSKAALNMFIVQNAKDLGAKGVKVFGNCPGLVRSNLRGTQEEEVSAGGRAGDPGVSGKLLLDMIEGKRDADVGRPVKREGVWAW